MNDDIEDAKAEGYLAYGLGWKSADNPYKGVGQDALWFAWDEGFNRASWDD